MALVGDNSPTSPSEGGHTPLLRSRDSPQRPGTAETPTAPTGAPPPLPPIPNKLPDDEAWFQPLAPKGASSSPTDEQERRRSSKASQTNLSVESTKVEGIRESKEEKRDSMCSQISYRSVPSPRDDDGFGSRTKATLRKTVSWKSKSQNSFSGSEKEKSEIQSPRPNSGNEGRRVGFSSSTRLKDSEEDEVEESGSTPQSMKDAWRSTKFSSQSSEEPEPLSTIRKTDTTGGTGDNEKKTTVLARGASTIARRQLLQMLNDDPSRTGVQGLLRQMVLNPWFEYIVAIMLLANAVSIGSRAEYRAQNPTKRTPDVFTTAELMFSLIFTAELVIRIFVFRFDFLRMKGWEWNLFDLIVVSLQFVESIFDLVGAAITDQKGLRSLTILRLLRLGRIVRLLRMVRLVPALKSMVYLIAASMQSFFWTVMLLALLMFGVAVHFTEMVADHREDHQNTNTDDLENAWGSLLKSITSLYQAILGGIDWKDLTDGIDKVSWSASVVFAMYIAFASLVMLNLVTGVFVEGAQRIVSDDRDAELVRQAKKMFDIVDDQHDHQITWHEFAQHLEDPGMAEYFRLVGISRKEAKDLFQLLDNDHSGTLSIKEFVHGCLGLRGPAKSIDLARLAYNHELQGRRLGHIETIIQSEMQEITAKVHRVVRVVSERSTRAEYDPRTHWNEWEEDASQMQMMHRGMPSVYFSERQV